MNLAEVTDTYEELKEMVHDAVSCHFKPGDRLSMIRFHQEKRRTDSCMKLPEAWSDGDELAHLIYRY